MKGRLTAPGKARQVAFQLTARRDWQNSRPLSEAAAWDMPRPDERLAGLSLLIGVDDVYVSTPHPHWEAADSL